jgi:hypothetical protein
MHYDAASSCSAFFHGVRGMPIVNGLLIDLTCDEGEMMQDGLFNERNSVFTAYFLNHITQPNLTISGIMNKVQHSVLTENNNIFCKIVMTSVSSYLWSITFRI